MSEPTNASPEGTAALSALRCTRNVWGDPMTDKPTAEHIDAVARVMMGGGEPCEGSISDAHAILTSTVPAVHAALAANLPTDVMLTALVERGIDLTRWEELVCRMDEAESAVARVKALHVSDDGQWCDDCSFSWPCATIRALSEPTP